MGWKTTWEGLWRRKPGIYFSRICTKSELDKIPNNFRLIIKENKNHINNNTKTPRFVFAFTDAEEQKGVLLKAEETIVKNQIIKLCNEYKKMSEVAVNNSEKEFAKYYFVKKLIQYSQKLSNVNLTEVIAMIEKKQKNKVHNFKN